MSIATGWATLVTAFGQDCVVTTKFGVRLSVAKILAKGDVISKIESFGFEKGRDYKSHGRWGRYIRDEEDHYNVTDFFIAHSQNFTGVKGIIKVAKK